jgi:hypothetical protein
LKTLAFISICAVLSLGIPRVAVAQDSAAVFTITAQHPLPVTLTGPGTPVVSAAYRKWFEDWAGERGPRMSIIEASHRWQSCTLFDRTNPNGTNDEVVVFRCGSQGDLRIRWDAIKGTLSSRDASGHALGTVIL